MVQGGKMKNGNSSGQIGVNSKRDKQRDRREKSHRND